MWVFLNVEWQALYVKGRFLRWEHLGVHDTGYVKPPQAKSIRTEFVEAQEWKFWCDPNQSSLLGCHRCKSDGFYPWAYISSKLIQSCLSTEVIFFFKFSFSYSIAAVFLGEFLLYSCPTLKSLLLTPSDQGSTPLSGPRYDHPTFSNNSRAFLGYGRELLT